jgi:hypothetical protein
VEIPHSPILCLCHTSRVDMSTGAQSLACRIRFHDRFVSSTVSPCSLNLKLRVFTEHLTSALLIEQESSAVSCWSYLTYIILVFFYNLLTYNFAVIRKSVWRYYDVNWLFIKRGNFGYLPWGKNLDWEWEQNSEITFGPKRAGETGEWKTFYNEELPYLYSSLSIIRVVNSRRMR